MPSAFALNLSSTRTTFLLLFAITAAAFLLRVWFVFPEVDQEDYVRFLASDPWYHMRVVDNLVEQMPHRLRLDPYAQFPSPVAVPVGPLFDYLVAGTAWVLGAGSPSPALVDWVAAFVPPVLGALICLPVYGIGRIAFGRAAGLAAAAWLAIMPGGLLRRSCLGFVDHHVAEVLFAGLALLFLLKGFVASEPRDAPRRRALICGGLFGLAVGCYLLTWVGGAFLLLILMAFVTTQSWMDHLAGRTRHELAIVTAVGTVVALTLMIPFLSFPLMKDHVPLLIGLGVLAPGFAAVAATARRLRLNRLAAPFAFAVLGAVIFLALREIAPGAIEPTVTRIRESVSTGAEVFVAEARPLDLVTGARMFSLGFLLAPVGLVLVALRFSRGGRAADGLLVVWTALTFAAAFRQQRFGYYLAVGIALMSGFVVARVAGGAKRLVSAKKRPGEQGRAARRRASATSSRPRWLGTAAATTVTILLFLPNVAPAIRQAGAVSGPDPGWHEALIWMRNETPEPLGVARKYFARYLAGPGYAFPESAYGVLASWDKGYWISRIARRMPNANPTQSGAKRTSRFLTIDKPVMAAGIARSMGTRYIVLDDDLPLKRLPDGRVTGGLASLAPWAGRSVFEWAGEYVEGTGVGRRSVILYYPEYFESMFARLYLFDGKAVTPSGPTAVATYESDTSPDGRSVRRITALERFATYEDAVAYRDSLPGDQHVLASTDPFRSCVPLQRLRDYRLVYESPGEPLAGGDRSHLKVFEYRPGRGSARRAVAR